ncbi:MAG: hypothetical protein HYT90_02515 [Candidatus Omnitrophica bacterium]|nr:hypothetical protein [Candidatus Omnitrophota bacterium]
MTDALLLVIAASIIGVCLLATTLATLSTMREFRATLGETRELLARWNAMTRRVEAVVGSACDAASATLEGLSRWKARAEQVFTGRSGNGARAEPRRHGRSTRGGERG